MRSNSAFQGQKIYKSKEPRCDGRASYTGRNTVSAISRPVTFKPRQLPVSSCYRLPEQLITLTNKANELKNRIQQSLLRAQEVVLASQQITRSKIVASNSLIAGYIHLQGKGQVSFKEYGCLWKFFCDCSWGTYSVCCCPTVVWIVQMTLHLYQCFLRVAYNLKKSTKFYFDDCGTKYLWAFAMACNRIVVALQIMTMWQSMHVMFKSRPDVDGVQGLH